MSGIVGIINLDGAPVDRGLLREMTRSMGFRGPDALGSGTGTSCALADFSHDHYGRGVNCPTLSGSQTDHPAP